MANPLNSPPPPTTPTSPISRNCHNANSEMTTIMPAILTEKEEDDIEGNGKENGKNEETPTMASLALGGQLKRPTKLCRTPTNSGRPSVTFSLVLEEIGSTEKEEKGGTEDTFKSAIKRNVPNWTKNIKFTNDTIASNLGEKEEQEQKEPRVKLLLFCASVPLMECARFVGWLATIPIVISIFILPFAPSSLVELVPELALLGAQSVSVLALFFGLQHQLPNYLKPFLYFGLIWNLLLLLLLLFSLIELLVSREHFCAQIWLTLDEFTQTTPPDKMQIHDPMLYNGQEDPMGNLIAQIYRAEQALSKEKEVTLAASASYGSQCWLPILLVSLLAFTILLDGWLLNIVLLAYLHMKRRRNGKVPEGFLGHWAEDGLRQPQSCSMLTMLPDDDDEDEDNDEDEDGDEEEGSRQSLLAKKQQCPILLNRMNSCASSCSSSNGGSICLLKALNGVEEHQIGDDADGHGCGRKRGSGGGIENGGFQHHCIWRRSPTECFTPADGSPSNEKECQAAMKGNNSADADGTEFHRFYDCPNSMDCAAKSDKTTRTTTLALAEIVKCPNSEQQQQQCWQQRMKKAKEMGKIKKSTMI